MNIAFRLVVEQGANLRAFDDLRRARTTLAFIVETPSELVICLHLAELSNLADKSDRGWDFFKDDNEASYKQLPTDASHSKLAAIALISPSDHRMYGLIIRTIVFGAVAAALRYNVFTRLLSEPFDQFFGNPLLVFFGDFCSIAAAEVSEADLRQSTLFGSKL